MGSDTSLDIIPQPPGAPIIGNALTVDSSRMIQSLMELADEYGVSAERIRQLEANAIKKLRNAMAV